MGKPIEELHRLHDGEMEPLKAESPTGETLDADDQARLDAIAAIGAAVRNTLLTEARPIDVWDAIAARLPAETAPPATARPADPIAPRPPDRALRPTHPRTWRRRLRTLAGDYRVLIPALAAIAAAIVFFLGTQHSRISNGCDIELLDVRNAAATVLKVPDHDGQGTTTVIWTTEE